MSVSIEAYNSMQTLWAIIALSGIGAAALVGVFWFIKNLLRTKSGKTIDSVKAGHKQLLIAATPSHRANLFKVFPHVPGLLQTAKFQDREKKKRKVFYEAEQNKIALEVSDLANMEGLSEAEKNQRLVLTQQCIDYVLEANTQKVFIEDGVPLTIAVEDKIITTGVKGIGAMAIYEKLFQVHALKDKITAMEAMPSFKDVAAYLKSLASQITPIDYDLLRTYFNSGWDQCDDESQKDLYYNMGLRDANKGKQGFEKMILYAGIAIGVLGIAGGAVLAWLSKGG